MSTGKLTYKKKKYMALKEEYGTSQRFTRSKKSSATKQNFSKIREESEKLKVADAVSVRSSIF